MHAGRLINTLMSSRHANDLCVPECKDGPSQGRSSRRLDLWCMRRSYSRPATFGYEVKVSRADFLRDEKWQDYLPLCNQFYFVTPWKLVDPSEIPASAGLIWISNNCTRAYVKSKAEHRRIDPPIALMTYILMSRSTITHSDTQVDKLVYWTAWLATRKDEADLGDKVSYKVAQRVRAVEKENKRLKKENEALEFIKDFWTNHLGCGETALGHAYYNSIEHKCKQSRAAMDAVITPALFNQLNHAAQQCDRAKRELESAIVQLRSTHE